MESNHLNSQGNRSHLLRELVNLCMQSLYQREAMSELDINRLLSESVKNKLLSAEESYRLRDLLYQSRSATELIDSRIASRMARQAA